MIKPVVMALVTAFLAMGCSTTDTAVAKDNQTQKMAKAEETVPTIVGVQSQ